ncbi:hypothetical protein Y032_0680g1470 [Ancylostoma ceylanicum]|uniref:Uncharacterized protein n=1 Tax=Ancylostoma ceylanicum TaxID=53326 RepID=A0A016WIH0_9BILA|nr:hypothetical protein Y032_0680g1470 [Ancylostoma ceylanicum]
MFVCSDTGSPSCLRRLPIWENVTHGANHTTSSCRWTSSTTSPNHKTKSEVGLFGRRETEADCTLDERSKCRGYIWKKERPIGEFG